MPADFLCSLCSPADPIPQAHPQFGNRTSTAASFPHRVSLLWIPQTIPSWGLSYLWVPAPSLGRQSILGHACQKTRQTAHRPSLLSLFPKETPFPQTCLSGSSTPPVDPIHYPLLTFQKLVPTEFSTTSLQHTFFSQKGSVFCQRAGALWL